MVTTYFLPFTGMEINQFPAAISLIMVLACVALVSVCSGQIAVPTGRMDNQRTGQNINETWLRPPT